MKVICNNFERIWQFALMQKQRGVDDETIQKDIDQMAERFLRDFYDGIASKLSDEQDHIVKLVKNYWTDEVIYNRIGADTGIAFRPYNINLGPSDIEWLKQLKPYDVYFMIDEEGQLEEARKLLFPEGSWSHTTVTYNWKDGIEIKDIYYRNCISCLLYGGSRKCPGHGPCALWGKSVMYNDFCSRWEEDIKYE